MATDNRHSVSVAGVLIDQDGRALITQRRDNGHWEPPGGILELGETLEEGLLREIHEETGLTAEPGKLTGIYKNMKRGIVALVFRCNILGGTLHTTDETRAFRWVTADELPDLMDEAYAIRVLDALADPPTPLIREHDGVHLL